MKVLLIDDDEAITQVLKTAFEKSGFEVILAKDGTTGMDTAVSQKPNIILLDQVMPDISGNEVLKKLKENTQTQNIPIILLSNFSQEELVREAIQEGAADYVFKYQVEPVELVDKVRKLLEKSS